MAEAPCLVSFQYGGAEMCKRFVTFPFDSKVFAQKFKRLLRAHYNLVVDCNDIEHRIVVRCDTIEHGEVEVDPEEIQAHASLPAGTRRVCAVLAQLVADESSRDGSDSHVSNDEASRSSVESSAPMFVLEGERFVPAEEYAEELVHQPLQQTFAVNDDYNRNGPTDPWTQWLAEKGQSLEDHQRQVEEELSVPSLAVRFSDHDVADCEYADVDKALGRASPEEQQLIAANFNSQTKGDPTKLKDYERAHNRVLQRCAEQLARTCKNPFYPERREYALMAYSIWIRWPHVCDNDFLLPYGSIYNWQFDGPLYSKTCHYRRSSTEGKLKIRARTTLGGHSTKRKKPKTTAAAEPDINPAVGRIRQLELAKLKVDAANLIVNSQRMDSEYHALRAFRHHDVHASNLSAQQIVDNWPMVVHRPQCLRSDFAADFGDQVLSEDAFVQAGKLLAQYLARVLLSAGNRTVARCLDVCETFKLSSENEFHLLDDNTQSHFALFALAALIGRGKRGYIYNLAAMVAKIVHFEAVTPEYTEDTTAQMLLVNDAVKQPIVIALSAGGSPSEKVSKYQLCVCGVMIDSHAIDCQGWRAVFRALCSHNLFNLQYSDEAYNIWLLLEKIAANTNTGHALPACAQKVWGPFKSFASSRWSQVEAVDEPNLIVD